jgi:hypothetical protein
VTFFLELIALARVARSSLFKLVVLRHCKQARPSEGDNIGVMRMACSIAVLVWIKRASDSSVLVYPAVASDRLRKYSQCSVSVFTSAAMEIAIGEANSRNPDLRQKQKPIVCLSQIEVSHSEINLRHIENMYISVFI